MLEGFNMNFPLNPCGLFYENAINVSAISGWLYWMFHPCDSASYAVISAIGTLVSTWLLTFAYMTTKHILEHKVAVKCGEAVTKELTKKLTEDKKNSKKEKNERIL